MFRHVNSLDHISEEENSPLHWSQTTNMDLSYEWLKFKNNEDKIKLEQLEFTTVYMKGNENSNGDG